MMKIAVDNSDAIIVGSEEIPEELTAYLNDVKKPVLKYHKIDEIESAYIDFYQSQVLG